MRTAALALALSLPAPALALELPDVFTIELGPTFRGYTLSNDADFEADVSAVFLGFGMIVVLEDGIGMFSLQSDLIGGLALDVYDKSDPAAAGSRILRWTTHVPAWDLGDTSALGVGFDLDWAGAWAPGDPDNGTLVEPDILAGTDWVSVGASADYFLLTGGDDFAHAWVTLGALFDFDNAFGDAEAALFVGPLVRAEAEYLYSVSDLITLHPKVSGSWYFIDEVEKYNDAWAASTVFEWTLWLGMGLELDFGED